MANDPLIRDPKGQTGNPNLVKSFSKLKSMSLRADLAVKQFGQTEADKKILEVETFGITQDTRRVQNYLTPMSTLLHSFSGSAADLAKIIPAIQDIDTIAQKEDVNLTKQEKADIHKYALQLIAAVRQKMSLTMKVASVMKKVTKGLTSSVRDSVSEGWKESENLLVKWAGKALGPKKEDRSPSADKAIMKAKADALKRAAGGAGGGGGYGGGLFDDDDDDEDDPIAAMRRHMAKRMMPPMAEAGGPSNVGKALGTDLSKKAEATLEKILHEVTTTNDILRGTEEGNEQEREKAEREADMKPRAITPTSKVAKANKKPEERGLLSSLGDLLNPSKLLEMMGLADIGSQILKLAEPLGAAFGKAALVIGAFGVGWEFGKWLDDLSGNRMSNAVQHMAEWFMHPEKNQERRDQPANHNPIPGSDADKSARSVDIKNAGAGWHVDASSLPMGPAAAPAEPIPDFVGPMQAAPDFVGPMQPVPDFVGPTRPTPAPTTPTPAPQTPKAFGGKVNADSLSPTKAKPGAAQGPAVPTVTPSTPTRDKVRRITSIKSYENGVLTVGYDDGTMERRAGGSLAWRTNNPGNLRRSPLAIGTVTTPNGPYAVFPTVAVGEKAQENMLFGKSKQGYANMTAADAIKIYAPASENDVAAYQRSSPGVAGKTLAQYTPEERQAFMGQMRKHEGFKPGQVVEVRDERNAAALAKLQDSLDKSGTGGGTTVIAPQTVLAGGQGVTPPPIIIQPMTTNNPDRTVDAIRSANGI
jgi:hypothetical protein